MRIEACMVEQGFDEDVLESLPLHTNTYVACCVFKPLCLKFRVGIITRWLSGLPQGFDSKFRVRVSEFWGAWA